MMNYSLEQNILGRGNDELKAQRKEKLSEFEEQPGKRDGVNR
jgi:hypothetical protein